MSNEQKRNIIITTHKSIQMENSERENNEIKRVAAYCRVSTLLEEQELSYESQCAYYESLIGNTPDMELVGVYGDQGFSGLHAKNRPEFQRMIEDCLDGKIDLVMVKSISRFSRNTLECQYYVDLLKEHGVAIYFEREGINSIDPQCELVLKLLSAAAQEESNSISQTIQWAHIKNNESGNPTRICPYGYRKAPRKAGEKHVWLIDEEKAKRIRLIFELADQGMEADKIAKAIREYEKEHGHTMQWNGAAVKRKLKNEAYKGDLLTSKTVTPDVLSKKQIKNTGQIPQYYIENHHEPIVSPELFDRVQKNLEGGKQIG